MMDLLSVVAYYDAYLCRALKTERLSLELGAITYHFDRECFRRFGLRNQPGVLDLIGNFNLPSLSRRILKVMEMCLNLLALAVKFTCKRPDVIHVQYLPLLERQIPLELWFLKYCRFLGSTLVVTVHDIAPHDQEERAGEFSQAFEMADALICHSEAAKKQVLARCNVARERIWVIPHGPLFFDRTKDDERASARTPCGVDDEECMVLCQGMIRPYKGIEFLLDAWAELQGSGTRAKLIIAGSGESDILERIRQKVQALGLGDTVKLLFEFAPTATMVSYYRAADIVVYPYKAITTSGALMTGIAQRKAIVATSLPAFREILEDGKTALLCDYGDAHGLASALRRLIDDPALRGKLSNEAGKLSCASETWRQIAVRTKSCYESITGRLESSGARDPVVAQ